MVFENFARGECGTSIMHDFMGQGIFTSYRLRPRKKASNLFTVCRQRNFITLTTRKHATVCCVG